MILWLVSTTAVSQNVNRQPLEGTNQSPRHLAFMQATIVIAHVKVSTEDINDLPHQIEYIPNENEWVRHAKLSRF